jgi:hypothetical protein
VGPSSSSAIRYSLFALPNVFAIAPREAHTRSVALRGTNQKAPPVPVDPAPLARVAGPIPHFRKLAFVFGATATVIALLFVQQMLGLAP